MSKRPNKLCHLCKKKINPGYEVLAQLGLSLVFICPKCHLDLESKTEDE